MVSKVVLWSPIPRGILGNLGRGEVRKMRRGIEFLLAAILLWLVCQIAQVFLYEVPSYVPYVGFGLAGAGWLVSRHAVKWDKPATKRSWIFGILGLALILSGLSVMLGRFLENSRTTMFSWGTVAVFTCVVVTLCVFSIVVAFFEKYYDSPVYWAIAIGLIFAMSVIVAQAEGILGLAPVVPTAAYSMRFWVFLPAVVVFCWFHRQLSSPVGREHKDNFDVLRSLSAAFFVGRNMVWSLRD